LSVVADYQAANDCYRHRRSPQYAALERLYLILPPPQVTTLGIVWDPPDDAGPHHTELGIPLDPKCDTRFGTPESSDPVPTPRQLNLPVSVRRVVIVLKPGPGLEHWQRATVKCARGARHMMTPVDDLRILAAVCAGEAKSTVVGLDKMNLGSGYQGGQEELFRKELEARCKALRTEAKVECVSREKFGRRAEWRDVAEMLYPDRS
jgi:hypothetical protein